ncbi:sororin isoform X2 [Conger conger]|uniref:sororin isoform X2 n=1 Tax=Conger conger TaxID=82655 RepID=UPI002A5B030B|nr:sororin isoform X2 [Conger conger]
MSDRTTRPSLVEQGNDNDNPNYDSPHQRRRSTRLSNTVSSQNTMEVNNENVSVLPVVKRNITVRKIVPRKTQMPATTPVPSVRRSPRVSAECNKENATRLSGPKWERSRISTSTPAAAPLPKPAILSPILASADPPPEQPQDPAGLEWSQKVRRSYSRLSAGDHSFAGSPVHTPSSPTPCRRETLFGFEQLQTPPVAARRARKSGVRTDTSLSVCGGSFSLQEGNGSVADSPECDPNIPGVALVKEKRRRKKVQQIKMSEFDLLAAQMNAEFVEAESFDLVVE